MNDKTKKKKYVPKKKKDAAVEQLAADILNNAIEEVIPEVDDTDEVVKTPKTPAKKKVDRIPDPNGLATPPPMAKIERIQFDQGLTRDTAFIVHHEREIEQILMKYFGGRNGDFFMNTERTSTTVRNNTRVRHKVAQIEDKYGFRYVLWFDVSSLGPIY